MADELRKGRGFAFAIVPTWLLLAGVSSRAVHVYALLAQHANDGDAFPSRQRLAEQAGCSTASIKRAVAELVNVGAVSREQRTGPNGEHRSNLYRVHQLPDPAAELSTARGSQVTHPRVTGDPPPGSRVTHRTRPTGTRNARARSTGNDLWTDDDGRVWVGP